MKLEWSNKKFLKLNAPILNWHLLQMMICQQQLLHMHAYMASNFYINTYPSAMKEIFSVDIYMDETRALTLILIIRNRSGLMMMI
jgi:hypothetical protein